MNTVESFSFPYSETGNTWRLVEYSTNEDSDLICSGTLDYCLFRAASHILDKKWVSTEFLTISTLYEWKQKCLMHGFTWCEPKGEYWAIYVDKRH